MMMMAEEGGHECMRCGVREEGGGRQEKKMMMTMRANGIYRDGTGRMAREQRGTSIQMHSLIFFHTLTYATVRVKERAKRQEVQG
jgi:hypothetical protein